MCFIDDIHLVSLSLSDSHLVLNHIDLALLNHFSHQFVYFADVILETNLEVTLNHELLVLGVVIGEQFWTLTHFANLSQGIYKFI